MKPITRKELYLNKIVGNNNYETPEKPITTEEFFFAEILGEAVQAPEPLTRYQMYLAKIAGREIEIPYPEVRLEYFLAKAAGMDIETPVPITKEEIYWSNYTAIVEFELEGVPPLAYKAIEGFLTDYRIYGQTVDGESVGDRTGNLWDGTVESGCYIDKNTHQIVSGSVASDTSNFIAVEPNTIYTFSFNENTPYSFNARVIAFYTQMKEWLNFTEYHVATASSANITTPNNCYYIRVTIDKAFSDIMLNSGSSPLPYEPYGYKVPVTVEGKNLCNNSWEQKLINADTGNADPSPNAVCCDFIPVKPNVTYSCSRTIRNNYNNLRCYGANKNYLGTGAVLANKGNPLRQWESFGTFVITDARVSYIRFNDMSNSLDTKYMLVEGAYTAETMPSYEPYRTPVTTPIYLPEQIRKVGDEAEYIDYADQKLHRIGAEDIDVTLLALPTLTGTNVLTVGTAVQPSKIYIKGQKERE